MSDATVTRARERPPVRGPSETLGIEIIEGPDVGQSFVLSPASPQRILIGTGPACDLRLTDPTVSRRHVAIEPSGDRFRITDLTSTNGTSVDGVALLDGFLRGGETVRCGDTTMRTARRAADAVAPSTSRIRFGRVLGASEPMRRLYPLCDRLAAARVPVLIEGETGTGKEVLAESLHELSGLPGQFVVFDCTTVAVSMIEAELFGHERGAFTGAVAARPGLLEQAHHGTLFIDEIGDLDLQLQPKLLRAVERGESRRVGGRESIRSEVRILCATRRDLDREVAEGRFRDDLFHRLAVARLELPPLRERKGDITLLARAIAEQLGAPPEALSRAVLDALEAYSWPGNVRELRNAVARRIELGDLPHLARALPPLPLERGSEESLDGAMDRWVGALLAENVPFPIARRRAQEQFERRFVARVLAEHGGNVSRASIASGIGRRYFQVVKARTSGT